MIKEKEKDKVFKKIDEHRDEMIIFLQKLVQTPSVSGLEKNAQDLVAKELSELNSIIDIFNADEVKGLREHPDFFETIAYKRYGYKARPNVVSKIKGVGKGKSLILSGHIDVVPPDPIEDWSKDPWGATIEEGRLYGRGALDMKSGIAAMIYAVKCLKRCGISLKGDLIIETTIEEELGGVGGALATIIRGYTADAAIITEPHYSDIMVASGGVLTFRIKVEGKTAHAYQAHKGVNAIMKIMKICNALTDLNIQRQSRIKYQYVENMAAHMRGRATSLNIGVIRGGEWLSTVPGFAEVECRIGYPPGNESREDVMSEIEKCIFKVAKSDQWLRDHPPKIEWFGWKSRPHEQNINHPFVKLLKTIIENTTGNKIRFTGGFAGNDARFFVLAGNTPAVLFGPTGKNLHASDEYVEIESIIGTAKVLALTTMKWCGYKFNN